MKTLSLVIMMALALFAFGNAHAQYMLPAMGYGFDAGIIRGDNAGSDELFRIMGRANLQIRVIDSILAQVGIGYGKLGASGVVNSYDNQELLLDGRILFAPIRMERMFPFLYTGIGVAKDMSTNNSGFLPYIPIGVGIQTAIGDQLMLKGNVGYNLVLSDDLDYRTRTDNNLNRFTNGKHDGFYEIMAGIVYSGPLFTKKK